MTNTTQDTRNDFTATSTENAPQSLRISRKRRARSTRHAEIDRVDELSPEQAEILGSDRWKPILDRVDILTAWDYLFHFNNGRTDAISAEVMGAEFAIESREHQLIRQWAMRNFRHYQHRMLSACEVSKEIFLG